MDAKTANKHILRSQLRADNRLWRTFIILSEGREFSDFSTKAYPLLEQTDEDELFACVILACVDGRRKRCSMGLVPLFMKFDIFLLKLCQKNAFLLVSSGSSSLCGPW